MEKATCTAAKASIPAAPPDLLPAWMLNEFAYCRRLAYLEWMQGEWAESADTVEGQFRHRRLNRVRSLALGWSSHFGLGLFVAGAERE